MKVLMNLHPFPFSYFDYRCLKVNFSIIEIWWIPNGGLCAPLSSPLACFSSPCFILIFLSYYFCCVIITPAKMKKEAGHTNAYFSSPILVNPFTVDLF